MGKFLFNMVEFLDDLLIWLLLQALFSPHLLRIFLNLFVEFSRLPISTKKNASGNLMSCFMNALKSLQR